MEQKTLSELERDVEVSRARFAENLAILRSPGTYAGVSGALKLEARDAGRDVMQSIRSRASGYWETIAIQKRFAKVAKGSGYVPAIPDRTAR